VKSRRHVVAVGDLDATETAGPLPVGDPHTEQVALGPLISERQLADVDRIVTSTVAADAELRVGGTDDRLFYGPAVLGRVTQAMPAFREEIFGPVAPVTVVKDDSEAIAVANDTEYGLVAAIQTGSRDRGRAMADQLGTGIVHVNDQTLNNDAYAPFGGTRASGNGARFGSQSSWDEFTHWRWITVRDQAHGFPF
jgi:benzaldehyde dehydrogenase (NAD)